MLGQTLRTFSLVSPFYVENFIIMCIAHSLGKCYHQGMTRTNVRKNGGLIVTNLKRSMQTETPRLDLKTIAQRQPSELRAALLDYAVQLDALNSILHDPQHSPHHT